MPTPTTRFANLANMKALFAGLKSKYAPAQHSHDEATTTAAGMMSAADKAKLDGVAANAEANVVKGVDGTTIAIDANGIISVALPNLDGVGY